MPFSSGMTAVVVGPATVVLVLPEPFPVPDTVVVVVPPPTPTGLPLDLPPVAPGEPVRFSFAPGATVGTLAELGSRLDGRDLLLPGGAARP